MLESVAPVGLFDFFKRKVPAAPADPLKAYDGMIESIERQAAQVRRSAATLLALKGELTRDHERYGRRMQEADGRVNEAGQRGDARAERALKRDYDEAKELFEQTQKALDSAND